MTASPDDVIREAAEAVDAVPTDALTSTREVRLAAIAAALAPVLGGMAEKAAALDALEAAVWVPNKQMNGADIRRDREGVWRVIYRDGFCKGQTLMAALLACRKESPR